VILHRCRSSRALVAALLASLSLLLRTADADEAATVVRLATIAPEGTDFAREFRAFARDVRTETGGAVEIKWVFGGIAGNEVEVARRIERGQLDGTASGGMLCAQLSPTMRAMRIPGLVQTASEASYLLARSRAEIRADFARAGMQELGTPLLGSDLLFLREPVSSFADLRRHRLWRWNLDSTGRAASEAVGMHIVALPVEEASHASDEGRLDGFIGVSSGALAYQWWQHARVVVRLPMGFLAGCLLVSQRTWDRLPYTARQRIEGAAAKAMERMTDLMRRDEELLLGGVFQRQGLQVTNPPTKLRLESFEAMRTVRDRLIGSEIPADVLSRAERWLSDFRAEHSSQ
jgi:TRAP-type C4-dicarboxylate transport system substrate-binding protein